MANDDLGIINEAIHYPLDVTVDHIAEVTVFDKFDIGVPILHPGNSQRVWFSNGSDFVEKIGSVKVNK